MTGRENIFLNATILGMSVAEVGGRFDEIVEFAEIGDFLEAPVATYSSGMKVRLGFAIASCSSPDLLLVDEVLAVGDAGFRAKCYDRIGQVLRRSAVVLVSHNMGHIARACTRVQVMEEGRSVFHGEPPEGIAVYEQFCVKSAAPGGAFQWSAGAVKEAALSLSPKRLAYGGVIEGELSINVSEAKPGCHLVGVFYDRQREAAAQSFSSFQGSKTDLMNGLNSLRFGIGPVHLRPGEYSVSIIVKDASGIGNVYWSHRQNTVVVEGSSAGNLPYLVPWSHVQG